MTFGIRIYLMQKNRDKETRKARIVITIVSTVCTTCFIVRGVALIFSEILDVKWIKFIFFYLIGEVVPSALMIFIFREAPSLEERFYQNLQVSNWIFFFKIKLNQKKKGVYLLKRLKKKEKYIFFCFENKDGFRETILDDFWSVNYEEKKKLTGLILIKKGFFNQ